MIGVFTQLLMSPVILSCYNIIPKLRQSMKMFFFKIFFSYLNFDSVHDCGWVNPNSNVFFCLCLWKLKVYSKIIKLPAISSLMFFEFCSSIHTLLGHFSLLKDVNITFSSFFFSRGCVDIQVSQEEALRIIKSLRGLEASSQNQSLLRGELTTHSLVLVL